MAKVDGPHMIGGEEAGIGPRGRNARRSRSGLRSLSLLHIMISLIYFAILSWSGKQVLDSKGTLAIVGFVVLLGLGACGLGLWVVFKSAQVGFAGWSVFVIGFMLISVATTAFFAILTLPILIGSIIAINRRRAANQQDALLWVLAVAAERGIPLAPGVQAFSGQASGMFAIWSESLADLLSRGSRLADALDWLPRLVARRPALLVRVGEDSGRLALGIREAVEYGEKRKPILRAVVGRLAYLGWVVVFGTSVVAFITYFIMPKYEAIFNDFGLELPEATKLVLWASRLAVDYFWVPALAIVVVLGYGLIGAYQSGVPMFDRLFPRRHSNLILRALAVVVSAERPVVPALRLLALWYPTAWVRRKLALAADDAAQGADWAEALAENGLLTASDLGVLASAQRAGNLAWALRELAESGERRLAYRLQAWTQVLFVVAMIVLGTLTLVLVLAYFAPLVTMIERLS